MPEARLGVSETPTDLSVLTSRFRQHTWEEIWRMAGHSSRGRMLRINSTLRSVSTCSISAFLGCSGKASGEDLHALRAQVRKLSVSSFMAGDEDVKSSWISSDVCPRYLWIRTAMLRRRAGVKAEVRKEFSAQNPIDFPPSSVRFDSSSMADATRPWPRHSSLTTPSPSSAPAMAARCLSPTCSTAAKVQKPSAPCCSTNASAGACGRNCPGPA